MKRLTGRVIARGDDGKRYILFVFRDTPDVGADSVPGPAVEDVPELQTSEGQAVTIIGKGRYQVVRTGMMLHSDAPDAL